MTDFIADFIFFGFAFLMVFSAICVISVRNPVYSVLWLIFCFFNSAGIFLMLGAELIAMLMVIVYVGAVAVLFLFVVMMLDINITKLKEGFLRILPIGLIFASILGFQLYSVIKHDEARMKFIEKIASIKSLEFNDKDEENTRMIGKILYTDYILPFQISGLILFLAMVGAIILTQRERRDVKKQDISTQLRRDPKESIKRVK